MKKLVLTIIGFSLFIVGAQAQTTAGSLMFGGNIRFTSTTQETTTQDQKSSQFQFLPSAGYFVADNLAVGVNVDLSTSKTETGNATSKYSSFTAGPFARYYMFTSNEKFAFTGEAGVNFGGTKFTPNTGNETKGSSLNVYISPGFTYFLSEKWGLDFQLQGISFSSTDPNKNVDNDKSNSVSIGANFFTPSLGFRYYIGN